jgi:nucleoside-diphosphate-sugar epimerase
VRVLLTGIDGYLGAVVAPVLEMRGHDVVGLDCGFYRDGLIGPLPPTQARVIDRDIRHVQASDLEGFDAVIHLAELSNDPLGHHHPEVTYAMNGNGSAQLAVRAKQAGVRRFLYSSSCSVYGVGGGEVKTEQSVTAPLTPYADCKLRTEAVLASLADATFAPTALRNGTAYGASPRMRFDIVLNQFCGFAWTTGRIVMQSDGSPWRPLVHVHDIADAFAAVLEAPTDVVGGQIFNVGSNEANHQVRDIAAFVAAVFPRCEVTFGTAGDDGRSYRVSFDKIGRALPAFTCRWSARRGAEELRALFQQVQLTTEVFEFRAFTRLAQLQHLLSAGRLDEQFFWRSPVAG